MRRVVEDLVEIALDGVHGVKRGLVVTALGNMKRSRERVLPVLLALTEDPSVAPYAVKGLGQLKDPRGRAAIERFIDHPETWIRQEAKRALAKLPAEG